VKQFICIGENIHCTRIYKVGGVFVREQSDGSFAIVYETAKGAQVLPIPAHFYDTADWQAARVKHCAVALWQGLFGDDGGKLAAAEYIRFLALRQQEAGATYLDINVDEYGTDAETKERGLRWIVEAAQQASALPVCIDSSNTELLRAGLAAADSDRSAPMLNSVSLERTAAIDIAREFNAAVVASAAGETDLPCTTEGRLANLNGLIPTLRSAGFKDSAIHVDPLVFPISTDQSNGTSFLEAVSAIRQAFGPDIHIAAGLSNISFGMPARKLLNQVFAYLAIEAGADGGIVDPLQISAQVLGALDTESLGFKMARAVLLGEDEFGMDFITAVRAGEIQ
jgi:5-methyltetrahydrofolate--homocysteine methyltransferase